jgi:DNA-binding MarR family transcriptional regulator
VSAHHVGERRGIGWACGGGEHCADLSEVVGTEETGCDDGECPRVGFRLVVEPVDYAARDVEDVPLPDLGSHLNVLQYPGPDGVRPSELAARLRVSKQALNYLLGQLERLGYLERVADEQDQRSRRVSLTRRGHEALRTIRDAVAEVEAEWAELLGARRFAQLRALLVELSRSPS